MVTYQLVMKPIDVGVNYISVCAWWRFVEYTASGDEVWQFDTDHAQHAAQLLATDPAVISYSVVTMPQCQKPAESPAQGDVSSFLAGHVNLLKRR
jgi:hypothetical protein